MNKDVQQVTRALRKQGWHIGRTRKGHMKLTSPLGRVVVTPSTPSDRRAVLNMRAQLRKEGAVL